MNIERTLVLALGVTLLGGCAAYGNVSTGQFDPADMGEANRQTYAAMIVNPEPVYDSEMETSAEHAAQAIDRYREDAVKEPETIRSTEVSGGSGGGGSGGGSSGS